MKHTKLISSIILTTILATGTIFAWTNIITVSDNDPLTSTLWNNLVSKINENGNKVEPITNNSGNIGIGVSTPTSALEVSGGILTHSVEGADAISLRNSSNGGIWSMRLQGDGTTSNNLHIDYSEVAGSYFTIRSNGNIGIGTAAPTQRLHVGGNILATNFLYSSDKRLKTNIRGIPDGLEKIKKLQGVSFVWKESKKIDIGFIAQDVEKIIPDLVETNSDGMKSVKYGNITAVLVEAMKEQQKQIDILQEKISILEQR